jgi:spore germination cell wall hydrolase CwlJ-like protein
MKLVDFTKQWFGEVFGIANIHVQPNDTNLDVRAIELNRVRVVRQFNYDHGTSYPVPLTNKQRVTPIFITLGVIVTLTMANWVDGLYTSYHTMKNEYNTILQEISVGHNIDALNDPTQAATLPVLGGINVTEATTTPISFKHSLGVNIRGRANVAVGFPNNPISDKEFACLTEGVYFESTFKGTPESFTAMIAVAEVMINRRFNTSWPNNICDVISQGDKTSGRACQFSYRCDGKADNYTSKGKLYTARLAAYTALVNDTDITLGATHYFANYVSPKWRYKMTQTVTVGAHLFFIRKVDYIRPEQQFMSSKTFHGDDMWKD